MWWIINFDIWAIFGATVIMLLYLLRKPIKVIWHSMDNVLYGRWYDSEVRPLMDKDENMRNLSKLARKELRRQAIQRARMAE
jgi:hypothetical protein